MSHTLKAGMMLPGGYAAGNPFNGVREQALAQADALETLGVEVVRMNPWEKYSLERFDVVQFYTGAEMFPNIHLRTPDPIRNLVFAPIIDSLMPKWLYRLSGFAGRMIPKIETVQSHYQRQTRAARLVIARSAFERDMLVDGVGVEKEKVRIVLNGVPDYGAYPEVEVPLSLPTDAPFILHISRVTQRRKNVLNLVKAVGPLGMPMIIAGVGYAGPYYREILKTIEAFPTVHYIGPVSELTKRALFARARLFCLPSTIEGTGLAALEAAWHGARVVITRHGGTPDYFGNLATYTDAGTVAEIRRRVEEAWYAPDDNTLQKHVREQLTWAHSARTLLNAYRELK